MDKIYNHIRNKMVFAAMSGGVDSSVAALLLKNQGYDVVGVFMRCYNIDGCEERDAEDARRAAEHLDIPFYVWDFEEEYKKRVVKYMVDGYRQGITPNPDVMCNREIKFGLFLEKALAAGADFMATGHYVRLERDLQIENCKLKIAKDLNKDQSYFLWTLKQEQLRRCLFPVGDYLKSEVREMARRAGLPTAEKKDSQGICFLGKVALTDFLKQYVPVQRGAVLTTAGCKIGEHDGTCFYTIGQRHIGANFNFPKTGSTAARKPFYVARKDAKTNTVILAEGGDNPALYRKEVALTNINFIDPPFSNSRELENGGVRVFARVRYRQPLAKATIVTSDDGRGANLMFNEPQKFVAPGQSAVFYAPAEVLTKEGSSFANARADMEMLGGGIIL